MVPSLRRRHRQIWRILAVLLPAAYFVTLCTLRPPELVAGALPGGDPPGAVAAAGEPLRVEFASGEGALHIDVLAPLTSPSTVVFFSGPREGSPRYLLGQLGPRGRYRFPLDSTLAAMPRPWTVSIVDAIKKDTLHTINLP